MVLGRDKEFFSWLKRFCLASFVCFKFLQVSFDHIPNMAFFLRIETKSWVCKKLNLLQKFKNTPIFPHIQFQSGKLVILTVNVKPRLELPCKQKLCPLKSSLLSFYHFVDKAEFPCHFQNSVDLKIYQVYYLRVQSMVVIENNPFSDSSRIFFLLLLSFYCSQRHRLSCKHW